MTTVSQSWRPLKGWKHGSWEAPEIWCRVLGHTGIYDSKHYIAYRMSHVELLKALTKMSSDSWLSLTDSPFNCCCKCPTAWGRSRAGMNQSWSSSSSISWKQRSKKSCSCSSSSTCQERGILRGTIPKDDPSGVLSPSEVLTLQLRTMGRRANDASKDYCGLNEKCSQLAHVSKYLVPSWWCYLGTSQNLYEVEPWWRKYVSVGRLWDLWTYPIVFSLCFQFADNM